ncbi:MAG: hypothetical protein ABIL58_25295 [Pseudomonadota bacterium]
METQALSDSPRRITDLTDAAKAGFDVTVDRVFDILPVDFHHAANPFHAYIFLVHYQGAVAGKPFAFRKCYARGCPHNLCTHVHQAVIIANRYLERDRQTLATAGILLEDKGFTLEDMVVKFERRDERSEPALTIPELIVLASGAETAMTVAVSLEYMPAVEHFANQKNAQTYLSGEFIAQLADNTYRSHRCFACYGTDSAAEEKPRAVIVANARLAEIYKAFDKAGADCKKRLFI